MAAVLYGRMAVYTGLSSAALQVADQPMSAASSASGGQAQEWSLEAAAFLIASHGWRGSMIVLASCKG